jgi:hypothetical protein
MARYRETFRRHRRLLIVPIIVSAVVAGWFSFGAAPTYRSSASLWIDNGPSDGTSLNTGVQAPSGDTEDGTLVVTSLSGNSALADPSGVEQELLDELLYTPGFDYDVGKGSSLQRYLASGVSSGFAPTDLLHRSTEPLEERIATAVGFGISSATPGPQVLRVSFTGPTPAVAQSVLGSVITHMQGETSRYGQDFGKTAEALYRTKLQAAQGVLANAKASLAQYESAHQSAVAGTDQIDSALAREVKSATTQLALATSGVDEAAGATASGAQESLIRVIDPPSLPAGQVTGFVERLLGVFGGLFAGVLIAGLGLVWLTPGSGRAWDAELSEKWLAATYTARPRAVRPTRQAARRGSSPAPRRARASATAKRVIPAPDPNRAPETA